ncbi:hypothetical protein BU26DRAFT_511293 [Trematosphaeria pertusa]|uniref:Uncharacterized protein n=1 Tax=Trematosphaeria pertusa TaxID=390896 RepID=A0A6A6HUR1_9PLEO|nr:uncharacterized protein BU26DRAFT_511293 [Trematosphaeria pertusa]KAF2241502.1 hypothetical protein BU26DRAFT_511293 [Trematosphaeria pertusa]
MSNQYDYAAFEQQRAPASPGTPVEQQLRNYFQPQSSEATEEVLFGYYKWLDWYGSNVNVDQLLEGDWSPEKEKDMRCALKAITYPRTWGLGSSSGTKTRLVVTPVMCTPYYVPQIILEGFEPRFNLAQAYGPVLYSSYQIRVSAPAVTVAAPSKPASESTKNSSPIFEAEDEAGDSAAPAEDSNPSTTHCPSATAPEVIPAAAPAMDLSPELLAALRKRFTTKMIHIGKIEAFVADPGADPITQATISTETPYAAVSIISAGRVEGIFAIPVDGPRGHTLVDDYLCLEAWEPNKRGVYYLGINLAECAAREWELRDEVEVVEVISLEGGKRT